MATRQEAQMNEKLRKLKNELRFKSRLIALLELHLEQHTIYAMREQARRIVGKRFRKASPEIKAFLKGSD